MAEAEGRTRVIGANRFAAIQYRASWIGCLLGGAATIYFLGGLAGYVGNPVLNLTVAALIIFAVLFFLRDLIIAPVGQGWLGWVLWLLILMIVAAETILGLVPPIARDELTHHLLMPRLYVRSGSIIEIPFAPYSYYPMLLDMLYTPWVGWGWDSIPKLVHGLFGFLTGLLLFAYLSRRMSPIYGLLGFFFFASTPAVLRLATWAYVDLGVVFYSTASLLCLMTWLEDREDRRWLVIAGLSAGFTAASKPNGFLAVVLLAFLLALALAKEAKPGVAKGALGLALFGLIALVPMLPWLAKNWLQTGNPFYPLLTGFFSATSGGSGGEGGGGAPLGIFLKRQLLYGESWWEIAALPLRLFISGRDDDPRLFDGVLNPILILFLPWAFKGKWFDEKKLLAGFALLYFLYAFFLAELRIRYILPIVSPLVILLVFGIHNVYLRIKRPGVLAAALLLFSTLNGIYFWRYFQEVSPIGYLTGRESRDDYLSRRVAEYPAYRYINRNLPEAAKIYLLFVGRRAYYCERDYFHDGGELPEYLLGVIRSAQNESDIRHSLNHRGLSHFLVREDLFLRFFLNNLSSTQLGLWNRFASSHLRGLFRSQGYSVYQIHD